MQIHFSLQEAFSENQLLNGNVVSARQEAIPAHGWKSTATPSSLTRSLWTQQSNTPWLRSDVDPYILFALDTTASPSTSSNAAVTRSLGSSVHFQNMRIFVTGTLEQERAKIWHEEYGFSLKEQPSRYVHRWQKQRRVCLVSFCPPPHVSCPGNMY